MKETAGEARHAFVLADCGLCGCETLYAKASVRAAVRERAHMLKRALAAPQWETAMDQMVLYKGFRIRAYRNGRGYGSPRPKSRLGGGRVLAITTTPMTNTLLRPPDIQRQKPPLIS